MPCNLNTFSAIRNFRKYECSSFAGCGIKIRRRRKQVGKLSNKFLDQRRRRSEDGWQEAAALAGLI